MATIIKMDSGDFRKDFRTLVCNFQYTVMPGLKNARAIYQRTMTTIFHEVNQHVNDLRWVFLRCRQYNSLEVRFWSFFREIIIKGIDLDPAKAKAI